MTRPLGQVCLALLLVALCLVQPGSSLAQRGRGRRMEYTPGMEISYDRRGVPEWHRDDEFPQDEFTFVRVLYNAYGGWGGGKWQTDWPDSDLNLSFRLQQLTALKVNPWPKVLELTDPRIFDYPWLYIIEPGGYDGQPGTGLNFTEEEVAALRLYCDNGGLVMVDDFWGEAEWREFYRELKRVFPDREPVDLELDHEIFNCVYQLDEKPQVPSIGHALSGQTYERWDASEVHYRAILDDLGQPQVIICHNTDLGDGWEREGENIDYFKNFSEPKAYPMGINILFYAMTH
jgi:hypothetical protein